MNYMLLHKLYLTACIAAILLSTTAMAQDTRFLNRAERIKNELSPADSGYHLVFYTKNKINDTPVQIFRFEPVTAKSVTLNGPHVTVILDDDLKLKGFARLNATMTATSNISENEAKEHALTFFNKYAPDLKNARFQWTNNHTEKITDNNGRQATINGTWVKYREPKSGEYLWVILAPDKSIMEFDRDIVWSFFRGGRVNELWLRDEWFGKWLAKNK